MSKFEVSHPDMPKRNPRRRLFTLAEAERSLPLVRRIVADIVTDYRALSDLLTERNARIDRGEHASAAKLDDDARTGTARLNELMGELQAIGCELKDWETGLVDFRALREGEEVYLCWRLGEDRIGHWHELHAGVGGRQAIDGEFKLAENLQISEPTLGGAPAERTTPGSGR